MSQELSIETASFELAQRQAKALSSSTLVPKEFQGNPANCLIALNMAARLKADPFMVMQSLDIIHGRPSFRAQFLIAMVNSSGRFTPIQFRIENAEKDKTCIAFCKDIASGETIEGPPVSMSMAKAEGWSTKSGSKWQTMPDLMLRYRAAAFFARLYAPDITLGMRTSEELRDTAPVRDVTPGKPLFPEPAKEEPFTLTDAPANALELVKAKAQAAGMTWDEFVALAAFKDMGDLTAEELNARFGEVVA